MKNKLEKKNHFRKNPNLLMNVFVDWASHNKPSTVENVLDMLHLTPQSFKYISTSKNSIDKDIIINKLYEKYLEINGKFKKLSSPTKTMIIHDMILNRELTPIDYSDVLTSGWEYENFRWFIFKLQSLHPDEDVISKYIVNENMEKYIELIIPEKNMNKLRDYIECIIETDSIMSVPKYLFSGLCKIVGYMLGVNSTFLEGATVYPSLFNDNLRFNMNLMLVELERMLLLYHYDNSVFDMNDNKTRNLIFSNLSKNYDDPKLTEKTELETKYDINLSTLVLPLTNVKSSNEKLRGITYDEFKTKLKHYNSFVVL